MEISVSLGRRKQFRSWIATSELFAVSDHDEALLHWLLHSLIVRGLRGFGSSYAVFVMSQVMVNVLY